MLIAEKENKKGQKATWKPARLVIVVLSAILIYTVVTHQDFGGTFFGQPEIVPTSAPSHSSEDTAAVPKDEDNHSHNDNNAILLEQIWTLDTADRLAEEFKQVAIPTQTDKVTTHQYQYAYAKYLSTWKAEKRKVKLLEIGLGCGMGYGPGASYHLWHNYFEGRAEIYFLEYQCSCAKQWHDAAPRPGLVKFYCGDQADPELLKTILQEAQESELFDFIIDDGGHRMIQQQVSLEHLLAAVKPGGVYFLEDLLTSYMPAYQDGIPTTVETIKTFVDTLNERVGGPVAHAYSRIIKAFECMPEICVFTTKSS